MTPSKDEITIESARREDAADIVRLISEAHLPARFVEEFIDGFVVARASGEVVGCGGMEHYGSAGFLRSFVLTERLQGQGLGRRLAEEVIGRARAFGIDELYLFTLDRAGFWQHLGFEEVPLDDWAPAARECWQYRYVSAHLDEFPGIHSMRRVLD